MNSEMANDLMDGTFVNDVLVSSDSSFRRFDEDVKLFPSSSRTIDLVSFHV